MPKYVNRLGASPLWQWLKNIPPTPTSLAWCHTTDAFRLRDMIKSGSVSPRRCNVFEQDLLYLFYGRPAFRRDEDQQLRLSAKAPVVIVFAPNLATQGCRMFPFDSGAFELRYQGWTHRGMELQDFEIECSPEAARRHVSAFFSTNEQYVRLLPSIPVIPFVGDFEVESIVQLLSDPSSTNADDRRLAVELQVEQVVPFESPWVLALIVPSELIQAPWLRSFISSAASIDILTYELAQLRTAGHYQVLLEERAVTLQLAKGWI